MGYCHILGDALQLLMKLPLLVFDHGSVVDTGSEGGKPCKPPNVAAVALACGGRLGSKASCASGL